MAQIDTGHKLKALEIFSTTPLVQLSECTTCGKRFILFEHKEKIFLHEVMQKGFVKEHQKLSIYPTLFVEKRVSSIEQYKG